MKRRRLINFRILYLIVFFVFAGFISTNAQDDVEIITDDDITEAVERQLNISEYVSAHLIDVTTEKGVVTLDGKVDNLLAKDHADKVAAAIVGVRSVINHLVVAPVKRTDAAIQVDVDNALLHDPATESYEINATVTGQVVTLTGEVDSYAEKQLAETVVKSVKGIKAVSNGIDITYKSTRTDTEIEAEIQKRLKMSPYILDSNVEVDVTDGDVILTGKVGSLSAKRMVKRKAMVSGVSEVNADNLEIVDYVYDNAVRNQKLYAIEESEIKDAVADAILYDPRTSGLGIKIMVDDGVVILEGTVDNLKAKSVAEENAKNTVGVVGVDNNLKVRPVNVPTSKITEQNIIDALFWDPFLERFEFTVEVRNQKVYLYGNVDTYFEKWRAEDVVSKEAGVVKIQNNVKVNLAEVEKTDEQIRDDILSEYFWSPFLNDDMIDVKVNNGIVTLSGQVDSWLELDSAIENAFEGGAQRVDNNLSIDKGYENNPDVYYHYGNYWF